MKFGTLIVDPPWAYSKSSRHESLTGFSSQHYAPLTTKDLCELPVGELAADTSVLALWTTWPFIPDALKCIDAWGFQFITGLPWVKVDGKGDPAYGVGYWFRGATEPLLIAKRPGGASFRSNFTGIMSPGLKHSRKPESVHEVAETNWVGPYLELFARQARDGWTTVGNEAPGHEGVDIRESVAKLIAL